MTLLEALQKQLPEPYLSLAIANVGSEKMLNKRYSEHHLILPLEVAFIWDSSEQGHNYWESINKKYGKI